MSIIRRAVLRLRAVFLFGRVQREMDDEMRAHLDLATERYMARGLTAPTREWQRGENSATSPRWPTMHVRRAGARWAESLVTDVRLALRGLRRTPLFAVVAVLSISIGIGATTGIVTLAECAARPCAGRRRGPGTRRDRGRDAPRSRLRYDLVPDVYRLLPGDESERR